MDTGRTPPAVNDRAAAASLLERVARQVGRGSSTEAVFGAPVEAHGYTVIPVARVSFLYGAGSGPELAGRVVERPPEGRIAPALVSGEGGGGIGRARAVGYIEMSERGTRYVAATSDWRRPLIIAAGIAAALFVRRAGR